MCDYPWPNKPKLLLDANFPLVENDEASKSFKLLL